MKGISNTISNIFKMEILKIEMLSELRKTMKEKQEEKMMAEQLLQGFINALKKEDLDVHNMILLKHGETIAQKHWMEDFPKIQYSVSKSFTSTAIGIAVGEGLLDLDSRVIDYFADDIPETDKNSYSNVTLRHLLTMSIGHKNSFLMSSQIRQGIRENWAAFVLSQPLEYIPGERFVYNNACTYLAAVMLQKAAGKTMVEYLVPRFFEPLDIPVPDWERSPQGYDFGASGLRIRTQDLVKLGQLYLQKGLWQGKRVLPESWVREATSKQMDTGHVDTGSDWKEGYGYGFWRCTHDCFRADGMYGQFFVVFPSENAVLAMNSHDERLQDILDCVWEEILPIIQRIR